MFLDVTELCAKKTLTVRASREAHKHNELPVYRRISPEIFSLVNNKRTGIYCLVTHVTILSKVTTWGEYSTAVKHLQRFVYFLSEKMFFVKFDDIHPILCSRILIQFLLQLLLKHCKNMQEWNSSSLLTCAIKIKALKII